MKFGFCLPSFSFADLDDTASAGLREFAVRAEALGYDALWVPEHLLTAGGLYGTAWLSPLEVLAYVAGATTRITVGTPAQIRERIEELAAAGLEYVVLSPLNHDLGQLDLWQEEIVRHFPG